MLPKRPVSCLAVAVLPVGLLLLLIVIAGYGLKMFFPEATKTPVSSSGQETERVVKETILPSLLPATISTTTQILVATASANVVKEKVFALASSGVATEQASPDGFRPEQWKTEGITLMPPNEAVTSSPWRITGANWNVPLRTRGGAVWQDPVILGKFASGRLAVVAYRSQRALLSVSRAGDIQVVDVLADELTPLTVQGKDAWFVRTQPMPDPSLDQLPTGPSFLVRLSEQGTSSTVAQDPAVILELVPSLSPSTLAYLSSDGSLVIVSGEKLASTIKGWRPQAWLDDRYLLVSREKKLGWVDRLDPKQIIFFSEFADSIRGVSVSTTSSRSVLK